MSRIVFIFLLAIAFRTVGSVAAPPPGHPEFSGSNMLQHSAEHERNQGSLDQGGDNCGSIFVINSLPFYDTGTTVGRSNDLTVCENVGNSPDVMYRFTAPTTDPRYFFFSASFYGWVSISSGPNCPGSSSAGCFRFFADTTGWSVTMTAGTTYYIIIDGYDQYNAGTYELHISDCPSSQRVYDNSALFDHTSGEGFWRPSCGISGYSGENIYYIDPITTGYRTIEVVSSFDATIEIRQGLICPGNVLLACAPSGCLTHHYYIPVHMSAGFRYWIIVDGNGNYAEGGYALYIRNNWTFNGSICGNGTYSGSTCGTSSQCSLRPSPDNTIQIGLPWAGTWKISLCSSADSWDSYLYVLDSVCTGNVLASNDDYCSRLSQVFVCTGPGIVFATIEGNTANDCGDYTLTVTSVYGSCCYGDSMNAQCSDELTLCQCSALGGAWRQGVSCVNTQCDGRPPCQPDAYWGQRPFKPNENWIAVIDDEGAGYRLFDDFFGAQNDQPLTSIRFWGTSSLGLASPCIEQPQSFLISFHLDDDINGGPRINNPLAQFSLVLTGTYIGNYSRLGFDWPMYQFDAVLPMPVNTGPYAWLSVQGKAAGGNPNCLFMWLTGPIGNGQFAVTYLNEPMFYNSGYLAHCVAFSQPCASPLNPPAQLTCMIVSVSDSPHVQLSWVAPSAGVYEIWSTTRPNNDGNPDGGADPDWNSEDRTVAISSGAQTWTDVNPVSSSYKNYVVIQSCRPLNDECEDAVQITNGVTNFTNSGSDTDGPPSSCGSFTNDVWFKYVALCTGTATVSACGSAYNTELEIFSGSCGGISLTCNNDFCSNRSQVSFAAVAGNTYLIRVGGYSGAQGNGVLNISCAS